MSKRGKAAPDPLRDAVLANDLGRVRALIAEGRSLEETDRDGRTPIFHAVIDRRREIIDALIAAGAKVGVQDRNGHSPLHHAAKQWNAEAARRLVEAGAPLDPKDVYGNTPLCEAVFASQGRGEIIQLLLAKGANPDADNNSGMSPRKLAQTIANYDEKQFFPAG